MNDLNNLTTLHTNGRSRRAVNATGVLLLLAATVYFPFFSASNDYFITVGTLVLTYAVLSQTLNMVYGYLGYMSISQVTFWGVGAYAVVKVAQDWQLNFWIALLIGSAFTALLAVPFGLLAMRRSRGAFAVVSIITMLFVALIANDWQSFTGGATGIINLAAPNVHLGSLRITIIDETQFYYATLVIAVFALGVMYLLLSSRWGRLLKSIKADEVLSASYGTNNTFHKVLNLAIAAFMASMIGAITVYRVTVVDPSMINFYYVAPILGMVLLGGGGSFWGVLVASVVLTIIPEVLRMTDAYQSLFYGVVLIIVAMAIPEGIAPTIIRRRQARLARRTVVARRLARDEELEIAAVLAASNNDVEGELASHNVVAIDFGLSNSEEADELLHSFDLHEDLA
jgi:branched-chain amino acid transport system permease protein